jgi:hypothetical protein
MRGGLNSGGIVRLSDEYEAETSHRIEPRSAGGKESRVTAQQLQDAHPSWTALQLGSLWSCWPVAGLQRSSARRALPSSSVSGGALVTALRGDRLLWANAC